MDSGNHGGPAPFLVKTYEMLEDPSTDEIVSWGSSNSSFIVWNPPDFSRDLLPKYFKHNNFSSFIRQLNTYGFRKIDHEQWEFANEDFIRGQKHLLSKIHRRKPVHSHSQSNITNSPLADEERQELEFEIERLKREKLALMADLHKHTEIRSNMDQKMHFLENRMHEMELRQVNILSYVSRMIQKPDLIDGFEHLAKKRRVWNSNFEKMEFSISYLENLFRISSEREEMLCYDEFYPVEASSKFLLETSSQDLIEVPEGEESNEIDVNLEPEIEKTNDLFWEQFLTENLDLKEVKSEESKLNNGEIIDNIWFSNNNVIRQEGRA
ncbi:hypothetical protein LUZ60_000508 [Juncus effusus]|nr:hypothetical protein LUZ60_000508 [Juncus effusus]